MSNKLLLIGAAAVAYYLYTQKKAIGLLSYYIKSVDGVSFSGFTPYLDITLAIQNPSNTSFTVKDIIANLTVNGNNVGSISSFVPLEIPEASEVPYPLQIRLNLIGLTQDLITLIQQQSGNAITINLQGYVNASGITAPINLPYKIAF